MKRRKLLLLLLMLIVILSGCFGKAEVLTQYVSEETISAALIDATTVTVADSTFPHIESETSAAPPSIVEDSVSPEKIGAIYELILVGENIDKLFYYPSPDGENIIIVKEIPLSYGYQWYFYLNDRDSYLCSGFVDAWTFDGNYPIWIDNKQVVLAGRYIFDIDEKTIRALGCGMDNETTEADKEKFADYYKDINQQYSLIGHVDDKYIDKLKAPFNELVGYNFALPDGSGFINCQTVSDIGTLFTKLDFTSNRFEHIILEEHETEPSGNLYYPLRTDGDNIYFFYNMSERIDGEHNPYSYYCRYDLNTGEIIKERVEFKMTYDLGEDGFLDEYGNLYSASDYEHIYSMSNNEYVILRDIYSETVNKEFIYHDHKLYYIDWESGKLICYDIQKNEQTVIEDTKLILSNDLAAFKTADGWCLDGYEENGQYYLIKERFVLYEGAIDEGYYVYDKYQFVLEGETAAAITSQSGTAPEQTSDIAESEQSEGIYELELVEERANKLTYFPSPDGKNAVFVEESPDLDANVWQHYLNDFTQPICDIYFYGLDVEMGIAQTIWMDNEKVLLPGGILYNTADNSQKRIGRNSTEQIELYPDIFIPITDFPLTNMYPLPDGSGVLVAESCWFDLEEKEYHSWEGTAILKYDYASDTLTCLDIIRHELSDGIYVQYWPMKAAGNNVKIYLSYRVQDAKKNKYLPYTYLYTYDTAREELIKEKLNYDIEWDLGDAGRIVSFDRYKETLQDSSLADGSCLLDADTGEIKAHFFIDWHIWNEEIYCQQQQDALYCDYKLYYVDDSLNELVCYDIEKDELTVIDDNKLILPNGSAAFYLKDSRDIEGWRFDAFEENGSFFVFEYCSFWDQKTDEEYTFYNKYQLVLSGENQ